MGREVRVEACASGLAAQVLRVGAEVGWRGSVEGVPGQGEGRPDRQMLFSGWMHLVRLCIELALTPCWMRAGSVAYSEQRR